MRKGLLCGLIICAGLLTANAASDSGFGTRVDFLNDEGVRTYSFIVNSEAVYYSPFAVGYDGGTYVPVHSQYTDIPYSRLRFVPWGSEKNLLTVMNSDPDKINLTYELGGSSEKVVSEMRDSVVSGNVMRFSIRLPENAVPLLYADYPYLGYPEWWVVRNGLTLNKAIRNSVERWTNGAQNMDDRKQLQEFISQGSPFSRDSSDPTLWHYEYMMENQPVSFNFSYVFPDDEYLEECLQTVYSSLYKQYDSGNYGSGYIPNISGEPFLMDFYGEVFSQDLINNRYDGDSYLSMDRFLKTNSYINVMGWNICWAMISSANLMLDNLGMFSEADLSKIDIAKAQLLTLRSHAYCRLLQIYAPRWQDSKSGSVLCFPLETTYNTEFQAPVSMKQVIDQCYSDLDEAVELFEKRDFRRSRLEQSDANVAKGVKARLALLREDWQTAYDLSSEIMEEAVLTTNAQLTSGFFNPANSWLWGAWNLDQEDNPTLYYFALQTTWACNGAYASYWRDGNAIDRDLFLSMKPGDVRRELYVMPETIDLPGIKEVSYWYDAGNYNSDLPYNLLDNQPFISYFENKKPSGVEYGAFTTSDGATSPVLFGSQTKFYQPGSSAFDAAAVCFMRSEEMLLTHAEAALQLGKKQAAVKDLNRLNGMRISGFVDLTESADLVSELRNARKIELWGEGLSWFDQKRWNLPLTYNQWEADNESSGNWHTSVSSVPASANNGWRAVVPLGYINSNTLMDYDQLGYKNLEQPASSAPAKQQDMILPVQQKKVGHDLETPFLEKDFQVSLQGFE